MANATNYLQDLLIGWMVDEQTVGTPPDKIYLALHDGPPGDSGEDNEVDKTGYSRYETSASSDWDRPSDGEFENSTDFIFDEAEVDWGDISHFSLWDGPDSSDNALAESPLNSTKEILTGDSPAFRTGSLVGSFE